MKDETQKLTEQDRHALNTLAMMHNELIARARNDGHELSAAAVTSASGAAIRHIEESLQALRAPDQDLDLDQDDTTT